MSREGGPREAASALTRAGARLLVPGCRNRPLHTPTPSGLLGMTCRPETRVQTCQRGSVRAHYQLAIHASYMLSVTRRGRRRSLRCTPVGSEAGRLWEWADQTLCDWHAWLALPLGSSAVRRVSATSPRTKASRAQNRSKLEVNGPRSKPNVACLS